MKNQFSLKKLTLMSFFAFAVMLVSTSNIQAQNGDGLLGGDKAVRFGVKGGVNLSQLYVDDVNVDDEKAKWGWHAGVFLKAPLGDLFAIQPELIYTNVGSKISYKGSNTLGIQSGEVRFNLNYVQLPVLASLTLGPVSIQAGPYVSYLVNVNIKDLKNNDVTDPNEVANLNEDDFERVDYGIAGGLAFDVKGFQLGARYNYGLRKIGEGGLAGKLTENSKNSVAQVFVAFGF